MEGSWGRGGQGGRAAGGWPGRCNNNHQQCFLRSKRGRVQSTDKPSLTLNGAV